MPPKRVRNLSPNFVRDVLPHLPPPPPGGTFNRAMIEAGMKHMTEAKNLALRTYWPHLIDSVVTENIKILMRDGFAVEMRVYKSQLEAPEKGARKVFFSMHGGGFVGGNIDSEDLINRQLSTVCGVIVFSIEYRLAPEHEVMPKIYNDVEDGFKWTYANASKYGGDVGDGIFVSGTSSGAAMAACLAFRGPSLKMTVKGLVMRQPAFIFKNYEIAAKKEWLPRLKSIEENFDAPLFGGAMSVKLNELINIPIKELVKPENSPIYASREELSRMPPTYIVKAGCDPVADEAELFADLLRDADVPVRLKEYAGMPHGFHSHHVLPEARQEMTDTAEAVNWLLELSYK